jgi:hypothetical protein
MEMYLTLAELLGKHGVSLFSQNAEELESDSRNARQLLRYKGV